ncbi:hypothetical protein FB451DRAFT_1466479, partial [Mycena latifolia]
AVSTPQAWSLNHVVFAEISLYFFALPAIILKPQFWTVQGLKTSHTVSALAVAQVLPLLTTTIIVACQMPWARWPHLAGPQSTAVEPCWAMMKTSLWMPRCSWPTGLLPISLRKTRPPTASTTISSTTRMSTSSKSPSTILLTRQPPPRPNRYCA